MGHKVILATCTLNQWALDFQGNYDRIRRSKCYKGTMSTYNDFIFVPLQRYFARQVERRPLPSRTRIGDLVRLYIAGQSSLASVFFTMSFATVAMDVRIISTNTTRNGTRGRWSLGFCPIRNCATSYATSECLCATSR